MLGGDKHTKAPVATGLSASLSGPESTGKLFDSGP